jgi:hypothetical protein
MTSAGPPRICHRFRGQLRVSPLARRDLDRRSREPDVGEDRLAEARRALSEGQIAGREPWFLFNYVWISVLQGAPLQGTRW